MSTRAMIGYLNKDTKKVTGIYSHWDGYPTGVGLNLMKFYGNPQRVLHLIDAGDVSAIDWDTGQSLHYAFRSTWVRWNALDKKFDNEWDRGGLDEKWDDVKPRLYDNMEQFLDETLSGKSMICYAYLFDTTLNPRWRCFRSDYGSGKIQEVELDKKKLIKGREKKNGMKDKIIDTIKIRRKVA